MVAGIDSVAAGSFAGLSGSESPVASDVAGADIDPRDLETELRAIEIQAKFVADQFGRGGNLDHQA